MKTITLTSPPTRGDYVTRIQNRLKVKTDGVYGPVTAGAVKRWKFLFGYHKKFINQDVTASDYAYLMGIKPQTALMKVRAKRRKPKYPVYTKRQHAVKIMQSWAADRLTEYPANSNRVPRLSALGREQGVSAAYYPMGWPWCAYSAMLAVLGAGSETAKAGLVQGKFNPLYVPEIDALAGAGRFGMRKVGWGEAQPGDFVIFNWDGGVPDHIGLLVRLDGYSSAITVEGNTSPDNGGSQSDGGGVFVRHRDRSTIQSIVRWS